MENKELSTAVITVTGLEEKTTQAGTPMIKLKTSDNKTFNVYKVKSDGKDSVAWTNLVKIPNRGIGQTLEVGYATRQGEYQGKPYTAKDIRTVKIAGKTPTTSLQSPQTQNLPQGAVLDDKVRSRSIVLLAILKGAFNDKGEFNPDGAESALAWYNERMNPPKKVTDSDLQEEVKNMDQLADNINNQDLPF